MSLAEEQPPFPAEIWPALANKLWHATHIDRALAIVADGEIRPDAPSKYSAGYCRSQRGVSLFDFRDQGSAENASFCGAGLWLSGHHAEGEEEIGVWFEVDVDPHIKAAEIYRHYWANRRYDEQDRLLFRDPMPKCEACFIGPIPLGAVTSVLLIDARRLAEHRTVPPGEGLSVAISEFRARVRAKLPLPPTWADILKESSRHRQRRAED
jgi:hypothetical protein